MPLSTPAARTPMHTRTIKCDGYEREDGLWDIEARMEDMKHYAFDNKFRGKVEPGEPLHEMYLRLTLNDDLEVQDVEAHIDHHPFKGCPSISVDYKKLIGVRIGVGWRRAIKARLGGKLGCTHLTELLPVLATVAIQSMMPVIIKRRREAAKAQEAEGTKKSRPPMLDSCHSWASDGPTVKEYAPEFYTGD
ncbi:MAG: hypothetical protein COB49_12100 [Alphaproteobacteria bacterium]|nr:MAG: hypothetical protein COB49_12100 [Alphaproteobacteria bacterium]